MNTTNIDSVKSCNQCYKNTLSVGGKYLFSSAKNTRDLLASAGFTLDEPAVEYFLKYKDLPKLFFFQQLGTLNFGKYTSINGFGVKQDVKWNIIHTSNLRLAPYFEAGVGYFRLTTVDGIEDQSINSVLSGAVTQRTLDNISITGDVGLEIAFGFTFDNRRLMIAGNGGFMTNYPSQWRNAGSIAFNEKLAILSPYAGLTLSLDMCSEEGCCK